MRQISLLLGMDNSIFDGKFTIGHICQVKVMGYDHISLIKCIPQLEE